MANTKSGNQGMDAKDMAAVGAGIAAIAAGAYFFFGPDGKKHQKKMRGWMVTMKGEVLERLEETRDISEPIYNDIVDSVAKAYSVAGKIPKDEIMSLATDLKKQWRGISRGAKAVSKTATRKPVAKATTKTRPRAVKSPAMKKSTNKNAK
jgi:hypothetical protein